MRLPSQPSRHPQTISRPSYTILTQITTAGYGEENGKVYTQPVKAQEESK